jgi:hypothetical protein
MSQLNLNTVFVLLLKNKYFYIYLSLNPLQLETKLQRWRLILGEKADPEAALPLAGADKEIDRVLDALYDSNRKGNLGNSSPVVSRWLGDIRTYFPKPVVTLLQKDAFERLGLQKLLLEPELLDSLEADVSLVSTLISLSKVMPETTKDTAQKVIQKVIDQIREKLKFSLEQAVKGSLSRKNRHFRPQWKELDWHRTIKANLKHYQPEYQTVFPEKWIGYRRKQQALRHFFLAVDQSASMANSLVYAGIMGSILAGLPTLKTQLLVFDTSVADLSAHLHDPVQLLLGTQLGGGTDIGNALHHIHGRVTHPQQSVLVIITDLFEGGSRQRMLQKFQALVHAGVKVICLLALNDEGSPEFDTRNAAALAGLGIPAFACSPQHFPDLLAAALNGQDLFVWQHEHVIRKNSGA